MNGILNINKPSGCTSQHVVSVVRKFLHTREVGHMGTLDPQGEGVLLIGVGKSTRLFNIMLEKDKVYEAKFCFGFETDTLDKDGLLINKTDKVPSKREIKDKLADFCGKILQEPPKYSAKHIDGSRAYDLARKGVDFALNQSEVEIFKFEMIECCSGNEYLFRIHCSSGTYIRSLCRDLAYSLGSLATMTAIKRTKCGNFDISSSIDLEHLKFIGESAITPVESVLSFLPRIDFIYDDYKKISYGIKFKPDKDLPQQFTVYCRDEFFGIGELDNEGYFKIKTYLKD